MSVITGPPDPRYDEVSGVVGMTTRTWTALGVALAMAASARAQQNEPSLELAPLVPPKAPWLRKNQKKPDEKKAPPAQAKKSKKKKAQQPAAIDEKPGAPFVAAPPAGPPPLPLPDLPPAKPAEPTPAVAQPVAPAPAVAQPRPAPPELPLPPLVPLAPAPLSVTNLGVLLQNDGLDAAAASRVEEGLRAVAKVAPLTRSGPALINPAQPCVDVACLAALAAGAKLDQLLVASWARGTLRVRLIDAAQKKQISEAEQSAVAAEDATASAEALACKLIVPSGCTGEISVDAADGVQLELDGKPLKSGERRRVAVGLHPLKAAAGALTAERPVAVSRESAPRLAARQIEGKLQFVPASDLPQLAPLVAARPVPAPAPAVSAAAAPAPGRNRWTRPTGIVALALGGALGVTGAILGAKSHSDLNKAESAFHTNGNVWRAGDLDTLTSGNSAAKSANVLFVASGALLAAGALLTFAF